MRWKEDEPTSQWHTLYGRVLEIGDVIAKARGLQLADEWPNHVRDHILKADPTAATNTIGYLEVLTAMRELGYLNPREE